MPASAGPPRTVAEELALLEHQQELLERARARRAARVSTGEQDGRSFVERAKDRWNAEVEGAVRWVANKDWTAAREDAEDAGARLWARAGGAEVVERQRPVAAARAAGEQVKERAGEVGQAAGGIWERGVRKSREVAAQAKAAVGLAEQKAERRAAELVGAARATEEERLLQQRYRSEVDRVLNTSVEEALAERYKPVEQQDSSKLRGV